MTYSEPEREFTFAKNCSRLFFVRSLHLHGNDNFSLSALVGVGGGLKAKYAVHLRFIGKPVVDFLLVIIRAVRK